MKSIIIFFLFSFSAFSQNRGGVDPGRYEFLSGIRNPKKDEKNYWDKKYSNNQYVFGKAPAKFLAKNYHYIPEGASVLDMGMGEGRHAVFLAREGYNVTGIDISSVAVKKAKNLAKENGVKINTIVASMNKYSIAPNSFDSIICFYYVDKSLNEKMISWLKPGGILIYEAHTMKQRKVKGSEQYNIKYLLKESELLTMFPKMRVLMYEEPLHTGEFTTSIILQKPL